MAYPLTFTAFDWADLPSEETALDKEHLQEAEKRLAKFVEDYEIHWRFPVKEESKLPKAPEVIKGDIFLVEETSELVLYNGVEYVKMHVTIGPEGITTGMIAAKAVTNAKIAEGAVEATNIANKTITGAEVAVETLTGENLVNGTITPKQLQGGATPAYSGKTEIAKGKEEEASATERQLVTITVETEKSKETVVEVQVNKVFASKFSVGAAVTTNSFLTCTVLVPAAQSYEVKQIAGKIEKVWASTITV